MIHESFGNPIFTTKLITMGCSMQREDAKNGIPPYMLGDKGYPLLDWLVTPPQEESDHKVLQQVFNRKNKQGKSIVKNAFWDLQENHGKIDMHVLLIPDSVILCILNNFLGSHEINVDIIL